MSIMAAMTGARLAYVVRPLEGKVKRTISVWVPGEGIVQKEVDEPAGFMVYFPRGHVLRFKDKKQLTQYQLDKKPFMVNMEGLSDPNSLAGKLFMGQSDEIRKGAYADLEAQVIALATAKTGGNLMPEQLEAKPRSRAAA